jgi:hypothetical protein
VVSSFVAVDEFVTTLEGVLASDGDLDSVVVGDFDSDCCQDAVALAVDSLLSECVRLNEMVRMEMEYVSDFERSSEALNVLLNEPSWVKDGGDFEIDQEKLSEIEGLFVFDALFELLVLFSRLGVCVSVRLPDALPETSVIDWSRENESDNVSSRECDRLGVEVEERLLSLEPLALKETCGDVEFVPWGVPVTDSDSVSSSVCDAELLRENVRDEEDVTDLLALRSSEKLRERENDPETDWDFVKDCSCVFDRLDDVVVDMVLLTSSVAE